MRVHTILVVHVAARSQAAADGMRTTTKLPSWPTNGRLGCHTANSSSRWDGMCSLLPGLDCHFYPRRNGRGCRHDKDVAMAMLEIPIAPMVA